MEDTFSWGSRLCAAVVLLYFSGVRRGCITVRFVVNTIARLRELEAEHHTEKQRSRTNVALAQHV